MQDYERSICVCSRIILTEWNFVWMCNDFQKSWKTCRVSCVDGPVLMDPERPLSNVDEKVKYRTNSHIKSYSNILGIWGTYMRLITYEIVLWTNEIRPRINQAPKFSYERNTVGFWSTYVYIFSRFHARQVSSEPRPRPLEPPRWHHRLLHRRVRPQPWVPQHDLQASGTLQVQRSRCRQGQLVMSQSIAVIT